MLALVFQGVLQGSGVVASLVATQGAATQGAATQGAMAQGVAAAADGAVRSAAEGRLHLWGNLSLADPLFLLALPLAVFFIVRRHGRRRRQAARMPVLGAAPLPRSMVQRLAWFPALAATLAIALVSVALARPLRGNVQLSSTSEGIDIALLVDRSGSMQHDDLAPGRTRLDVVREVVGDFAERRMTDRAGASDNVALIAFSRYPQLLCPFTLDVDALRGFLAGVKLVETRDEDGTAIGVALAKAVAVLRESESPSRIIVLLTDGENNIDAITPEQATQLAVEEDMRVYTILAGRFVYAYDFAGRVRPTNQRLDTTALEHIAGETGGRFFRARDREELEEVYGEIEALERTERSEERFVEAFDLYPSLLVGALVLYLCAWLSSVTWARRIL